MTDCSSCASVAQPEWRAGTYRLSIQRTQSGGEPANGFSLTETTNHCPTNMVAYLDRHHEVTQP